MKVAKPIQAIETGLTNFLSNPYSLDEVLRLGGYRDNNIEEVTSVQVTAKMEGTQPIVTAVVSFDYYCTHDDAINSSTVIFKRRNDKWDIEF